MSCPPPAFLEESILHAIKSLIGSKGIFILNLVCRNEELRSKAFTDLNQHFSTLCSYKLEEDINEVVFCSNNDKLHKKDMWKKHLGTSARALNDAVKRNKLNDEEMLDVTDFMNNLKL